MIIISFYQTIFWVIILIKKILLLAIISVLFCSCSKETTSVYTITQDSGKRNIVSYGIIECNDIVTATIPTDCNDYSILFKQGQSISKGETIAEYTVGNTKKTITAKHNGLICDEQKSKTNDYNITYFNLDNVSVITQVAESDVKYINIGDKVLIKGEGLEKSHYTGRIESLSSTANNDEKGTFVGCIISLDQPDISVVPGFTVKIESQINIENSVTVPIDAVKQDNKGYYVTLTNNSKVQKKYIDEILFNNGDYTVCTGLKPGDKVLIEK